MQHGELRSDRGSRLVIEFSSSSSHPSTSMTPSRQESNHPTSSSSSSTSPTTTVSRDSETREREDRSGIDSHPASVSCWTERTERPSVCFQANQNPKPNKYETTMERRDPLCADIPEWLQEFRENLVDDEVPEHRDSHASSSHELSLEPTSTRSEELGKHSNCTHFPKDRNCEICQRTNITRAPCRRRIGRSVPRAENFGDLITADHKVLSESCESRNNHRYAIVVQDLATQWIQSYPCKTKTSQDTQKSLQKFLEPDRKPKVIYTDNSLEFGKALWRSLLKSLYVNTTQIRNKWDRWESSAQSNRRHLCCIVAIRSGWTLVGRFYGMPYLSVKCCRSLIWWENPRMIDVLCNQWNAIFICETSKISCLMGKLHTRRFGEPFLKDQLSRLVHWLSITLSLRKISQESINLERKCYLDHSLDTLCTRREFGRVTSWLQTLRGWRRWTHLKSTRKDSTQRKLYFPKKMENSYSQSQMDGSNFLGRRSRPDNIHLDTGSSTSRRRSRRFSWRIRRVSSTTSRLISGCRWSDEMIFGPFQETSHTAITLNQESNFTRREKNHSLFHWNTVTSPELLVYEFGCQTRDVASMIIGRSMGQETCRILGQVSLNLLYWKKNLQTDICGPVRDWRESSWHPGQIIYGQNSGRNWEEMHSWRRGKSGHMKNSQLDNARTLRGCLFHWPWGQGMSEETIKNARKKLETPVAPAVPCKISKNSQNLVTRGKSNEIRSKHACILDASESTRLRMEESPPNYREDHIAGTGDNSLQHYNLVHKFIPMPQAMKIPAAKAALDKEWEKLEKIPAWELTKVRSKKRWSMKQGRRAQQFILLTDGHLSFEECRIGGKAPKIQRSSCAPRRYCEKWFWVLCSIHWTRVISITNDSSKSHGYHIQTARVRRTSS